MLSSLVSCDGCKQPKNEAEDETINFSIAVSKNAIKGNETFEVIIKNESPQGSTAIDPTKVKIKATISNEQGGAGSQLAYQNGANQPINKPSVEENLAHFFGTNPSDAQDAHKFTMQVNNGSGVQSLTLNLELWDNQNNKSLGQQTITWSQASPNFKLKLVGITNAQGIQSGQFAIQAEGVNVPIKDVKASITINNTATFIFNTTFGHTDIKNLAELMELAANTDKGVETGNATAPIQFVLADAHSQSNAVITISLKYQGHELLDATNNKLHWSNNAPKDDSKISFTIPDVKFNKNQLSQFFVPIRNLHNSLLLADKLQLEVTNCSNEKVRVNSKELLKNESKTLGYIYGNITADHTTPRGIKLDIKLLDDKIRLLLSLFYDGQKVAEDQYIDWQE